MSRWTNKMNYQKSYNGYTNIDGVSSYQKCLFADFFRVFELFENHLDNPKVRFMDCSDLSDSSDFAPTIISQCLDSSLMVPGFCY